MHCYTKPFRDGMAITHAAHNTLLAVTMLALLLTAGCEQSQNNAAAQIEITGLALTQDDALGLVAGIDMQLGRQAQEALQSGIPIVITVDLRLARRYRFFAREINTRSFHWELNYLPLSERYTLQHALSGDISSYPRLRMLLADLRQSVAYPWPADAQQQQALSNGRHQLQLRVRLNRLRLPAPLRLPALISSQWRLQDGWNTVLIIADKAVASTGSGRGDIARGHLHAF